MSGNASESDEMTATYGIYDRDLFSRLKGFRLGSKRKSARKGGHGLFVW